MPRISVDVDEVLMKNLQKRAKQNMLSVREMARNIIRRSMVSWVGGPSKRGRKIDDKLVMAFSRDRRGRKKRRK